jgi:hypothetical protein
LATIRLSHLPVVVGKPGMREGTEELTAEELTASSQPGRGARPPLDRS